MQQRSIRMILGVIVAVGAAGTVLSVLYGHAADRVDTTNQMAVGESFLIEPPVAQYVMELDPRERDEQARDWAVLATVARLSTTPEQAASATYELPPARLPYMDQLYDLEYGRGRRAYLSNRVLLFRDRDDPDSQATLGRLADRVRMENGQLPVKLEVYLVEDLRDEGELRVERAPDVPREALFSTEFGYVEATVESSDQLAAWLARTDDVTFAQLAEHGKLVLGGRRFAGTRTPNLTAEDVAALYQAHMQLEAEHAEVRGGLALLPTGLRNTISKYGDLALNGLLTPELESDFRKTIETSVEPDIVDAVLHFAALIAHGPGSPGFSLDPEWLPAQLDDQRIRLSEGASRLAANLCGELRDIAKQGKILLRGEPDQTRRTSRTAMAAQAKDVLDEFGPLDTSTCLRFQRRMGPSLQLIAEGLAKATRDAPGAATSAFYQAQERWSSSLVDDPEEVLASAFTLAAFAFYEADSRVQCARYEGLAGTEVGMTLFYTDLLAKLWESTDYGLSAPVLEVPGFLSGPRIDLPAELADEAQRNPYTRIWFGPRANAVSKSTAASRTSLAFEHLFSRIYAAGSNPAHPGVEEEPAEDSRRAIGWWDDHFEEIANHEPQYHRLNQIMKWSLITGALVDASAAEYLSRAAVRRDAQFATWQRAHAAKLRFSEALPVVHATLPGRECVPLIASYPFSSAGSIKWITGGVSTVSRAATRTVPPLNPSSLLGARKPFVSNLGQGRTGTATRSYPVIQKAQVTFADRLPSKPIATPRGPVQLDTPRITYGAGTARSELVIHAGSGKSELGTLTASASRGRSTLKWQSGAIEKARTGEKIGQLSLAEADQLAKSGNLVEATAMYRSHLAAGAVPRHLDDLGRSVIADLTAGRIRAAILTLQKLEQLAPQLSPNVRAGVLKAIQRHSSDAAQRVAAAFEGKGSLPVLVSDSGRLVTVRDVARATLDSAKRISPSDLADRPLYIDSRIAVAREGVIPGQGGFASRWRNVRGVRIDEVKANAIGELPDHLRLPDGEMLIRAPSVTKGTIGVAAAASVVAAAATPATIYVIRKCDADGKTETQDDDCEPAAQR